MKKLNVYVSQRGEDNYTDKRNECFGRGLDKMGHKVTYGPRDRPVPPGTDLVIQTAFAATGALRSAIEHKIPYVISEAPVWRPGNRDHWETTHVSWAFNGLLGGGLRLEPPQVERTHPILMPMRLTMGKGPTYIIGQKPNDHSLPAGHDHVEWIKKEMYKYPDATLRHHPHMHRDPQQQEHLADLLDRAGFLITFSSTVGADALIFGCPGVARCETSAAYNIGLPGYDTREAWAHRWSWQTGTFEEVADPGTGLLDHLLDNYDYAADTASLGKVQIPRDKLDSLPMMHKYLKEFGNA